MMKRLVIGGLAALAIGLAAAPVAQAHPCSPDPVCHEFDWAIPYYDAFDRHGISDLAYDLGIPMMNEVDLFCRGKASRENIRDIPTNLSKDGSSGSTKIIGQPCPTPTDWQTNLFILEPETK